MQPHGAWRALETAGAWLLGLLWVLPLVYAFWTAFHPPEYSARFDLLAPGTWTVVAHVGDGPAGVPRNVIVGLQSTAVVDLVVGGAIAETVTVTAAAPLVDRERTGGELSIDRAIVEDVPIAGRQVTDLALLDASVRQAPPADLFATARMLKLGSRLAVGEVHVRGGDPAVLVAQASVTYALPAA